MNKADAAEALGIDERQLSRYETTNPRDSVKREDPELIAGAMRAYPKFSAVIGLTYLTANPVVRELLGVALGSAPTAPASQVPPPCGCGHCRGAYAALSGLQQ